MEPFANVTPFAKPAPERGEALYREMPANLEAEQELLGALLINNDAGSRVAEFLKAEDFADPRHGRIFAAAMRLIERGEVANPVTLKGFFERDEGLKEIGGAAYLARLAAAATTIINVGDYARLIRDLSMRRQLIGIGEELVNTSYEAEIDAPASTLLERAEEQLFSLAEDGNAEKSFLSFDQAVRASIHMAEAAIKHDGLSGVGTGLRDVDDKLGGLHRSDLIILAGRPSMGKTALATVMAFNAAKEYVLSKGERGARVGFFSLEMSAEQLATRILSTESEIPSSDLRRGKITDDQFQRLVQASGELSRVPFHIDETGSISISALRTRARRLKRTHGLDLIVVDYLQLMRASGQSRNDNRVQEISEITQGLKALAKDLNVPVLALSQLSRAVESRDDKKPQLADLRESGAIEQDADVVLFVYREEYYKARQEPREGTPEHAAWQAEMEKIHNVAEVIIGKQRHGPIGTVKLAFTANLTRFSDLASPDRFEDPGF
jgi:replicative DNA helicase